MTDQAWTKRHSIEAAKIAIENYQIAQKAVEENPYLVLGKKPRLSEIGVILTEDQKQYVNLDAEYHILGKISQTTPNEYNSLFKKELESWKQTTELVDFLL